MGLQNGIPKNTQTLYTFLDPKNPPLIVSNREILLYLCVINPYDIVINLTSICIYLYNVILDIMIAIEIGFRNTKFIVNININIIYVLSYLTFKA